VSRFLASAKYLPNPEPVCLIAYTDGQGKKQAVPFYFDKTNQSLDVSFVNGFTNSTSVDGDYEDMYVRANIDNGINLVNKLGNNFILWYETTYGADSGTVKIYESGVVIKANVVASNLDQTNQTFTEESNAPISFDSAAGTPESNYLATVLFKKALVITYKKSGVTKYRGFLTLFGQSNPQTIFTLFNVLQNGTYDFPNFSGQILINDETMGGVTEWLVGGGVTTLIGCSGGCSNPADPDSGLLAYNSVINGYTWTQTKWPSGGTFTFITNRIRKSA